MFSKWVGGWSVYVIKLSGLHCTRNVCVAQRKGPEEELLRALLGVLCCWFDNPCWLRYRFPTERISRCDNSGFIWVQPTPVGPIVWVCWICPKPQRVCSTRAWLSGCDRHGRWSLREGHSHWGREHGLLGEGVQAARREIESLRLHTPRERRWGEKEEREE